MNTGGPAFPVPVQDGKEFGRDFMGLTIRDWFAGMAMQGILADNSARAQLSGLIEQKEWPEGDKRKAFHEIVAKRAYWQADAMLAQREKAQ